MSPKYAFPLSLVSVAATQDISWLIEWEKCLLPLQRSGYLTVWSEQRLPAGDVRQEKIKQRLNQADCIVLLVSPDFLVSDECTMLTEHVLKRHGQEQTPVLLLLLRPSVWQQSRLASLPRLPTGERPVTTSGNLDEAFKICTQELLQVLGVDNEAVSYRAALYEQWKMLDFKGIMHVEMNRPLRIPLVEVFVAPDLLAGIPEHETLDREDRQEHQFGRSVPWALARNEDTALDEGLEEPEEALSFLVIVS